MPEDDKPDAVVEKLTPAEGTKSVAVESEHEVASAPLDCGKGSKTSIASVPDAGPEKEKM